MISAIGLALLTGGQLAGVAALRWIAVLFMIGTVLFSFSIYLSVSLGLPGLLMATPIGGTTISNLHGPAASCISEVHSLSDR